MKRLFILFAVLLVVSAFVAAQEDEIPIGACEQSQYDAVADVLDTLSEALRAGEFDQITALRGQVSIATLRAFCDGYVFTSEEYGFDVLTDPITFRDGAYRAILETESFAHVRLETGDGDCDIVASVSVSDIEGGQDQDLWEFEGCIGLLNVNASEPWTLRLEPIIQND